MEVFKIDDELEVQFDNNDWILISKGKPLEIKPIGLFKYFTLSEFNMDALENSYIYLTNPKDFNDPFDSSRNLIIENQKELSDWDYKEILNDSQEIGITCLSESGMNPLMWSHYTSSYKGFCIKFNTEFFDSINAEGVKLKKVIYSNNPNSISSENKFSKDYQFILKLQNWYYEREWRLLFNNPKRVLNKYSYNEKYIEEITIGYRFFDMKNDNDLKDRFLKLKDNKFKNTPLYIVGPNQTKLKLDKTILKKGTVEEGFEKINQ